MYRRNIVFSPATFPFPPFLGLAPAPKPENGIPILERAKYTYYLRITQVLESITITNSFTLGYDLYRFVAGAGGTGTWVNDGANTVLMTWKTAPTGYPSVNDYLEGDVKNSANVVIGKMTMGWVSKYIRKAKVEVDTVAACEASLDNGVGVNWKTVFEEVGWEMTTFVSNTNVTEPSGNSWSDAEMHATMLAKRDTVNLDTVWHYHILSVRNLDSTERGIMYDAGATDSNNVAREGIGIAAHWTIPNTVEWGLVKGMRSGASKKTFFRTAVHEIGHALGLFHNTVDNGFMNTTNVIAAGGTAAVPFPNNVKWSYADDDKRRLRHYPDIHVRPGGTAFGQASMANPLISPLDEAVKAAGVSLTVSPLMKSVPLGTPLRVNINLSNESGHALNLPSDISFKGGYVSGKVIDASGHVRSFSPLVICVDEERMGKLAHKKSVTDDLTLLRGKQGALFPTAGIYKIVVDIQWEDGGIDLAVSGSTEITVTPAVNEAHAKAAQKVLTTPDLLLTLVLGGDYLKDGLDALQTAMNDPILRPHYAYIEAKRLAKSFFNRKAELKTGAEFIAADTVMSIAEIKKAKTLMCTTTSEYSKNLDRTLKTKVASLGLTNVFV